MRPWLLALILVLATAGVAVALVTSEESGTGAVNVGDDGRAELTAPTPDPPAPGASAEPGAGRTCEATDSNPGGANNYRENAPERDSLGKGFVIEGFVRQSRGCERLEDVRVQVWLATETGSERDNRASVRTDAEGRFRIETPPTIAQFGEPNIHVAVDGDERFEPVFIRRVVDLDDKRAVVNLTLRARG